MDIYTYVYIYWYVISHCFPKTNTMEKNPYDSHLNQWICSCGDPPHPLTCSNPCVGRTARVF